MRHDELVEVATGIVETFGHPERLLVEYDAALTSDDDGELRRFILRHGREAAMAHPDLEEAFAKAGLVFKDIRVIAA